MESKKKSFATLGRSALGAALLSIVLAALAAPVFGATVDRSYVDQVKLQQPEAVTVVPGSGNLVISDIAKSEVVEYSAFPALEKVAVKESRGAYGGSQQVHALAESAVNHFFYLGTEMEELLTGGGGSSGFVAVYDNFGDLAKLEESGYGIWIAVDNNPQSDSYGDVYVYTEGTIYKFDGYGNPLAFNASASYISGSEITGTPFSGLNSGGFQPEGGGIAIDPQGDIWVTNREQREIDEFDSSGAFLQRITAASSGAPEFTTSVGTHPLGYYPGFGGIAIDPTNGDVIVSDKGNSQVVEFTPQGKFLGSFDTSGMPGGEFKGRCTEISPTNVFCVNHVIGIAADSNGYVYVTDGFGGAVDIFSPRASQPTIVDKPSTNPTETSGQVNALIDPNGGGAVTECKIEYGTAAGSYGLGSVPCTPAGSFNSPTEVHAVIAGSAETTYHYRWVVGNASATRIGPDRTLTPHKVLGLRADSATAVTPTTATLHGSFDGNGAPTTYWFEYGTTTSYGTKRPLPAPPGASAGSPTGPTSVEVALTGLKPVTRYHFRIVAENGSTSKSDDNSFRTSPPPPQIDRSFVTDVHSNQVELHARLNPGGADTAYTFEYGTEKCSEVPDPCTVAFGDTHIGSNQEFHAAQKHLEGLDPGTTYYYRVIATNSAGTTYGPDRSFSTYLYSDELADACPNALARQQTGAALVTDCRGYELVSSPHAGGYDVESNLVPGQKPFDGYPRAESPLRVLYGIHNGAIPGVPGNPTNKGVDPYVATRSDTGWSTSYVGIPANNPNAPAPFSSTLAEANSFLDTFAFGGPDLCSPCFADGSTGVPTHLPNGSLVQGMGGSLEPSNPPTDGLVKKHFSDDGSHLVFSSTAQFEASGNAGTGDVSIYDRDFDTGTTQVVSTDTSGNPLACPQGPGNCHAPTNGDGIAELDISADGSRIVTGQRISTDSAGNRYWQLYMHRGSSTASVDLTPGASAGVLYDGMSSDGSRVFFTTKDDLGGGDSDTSADIYEASVGSSGPASLRLVTTKGGSASNDDGCTPAGTPNSWNAASGAGKCNAVAFAGGAGVSSGHGTFYFMSPELLDSAAEADGEAGEVNLYVVETGEDPEFVATIDSKATKPPAPPARYDLGSSSTLISGLENPVSMAVDQNSGDIYVVEAGSGEVSRWHSDGTAADFSSLGTNKISGAFFGGAGEAQVAVDSSESLLKGDFYVATNGGGVNVYDDDGTQLGEISGFGEACGVSVDQSNGDVYVGSYSSEVARFSPLSATAPVGNGNYSPKVGIESPNELCNIDASAEGHVYTWPYYGGEIKQIATGAFSDSFPTQSGKLISTGPNAQSDPQTGHLFVDQEEKVVRYDTAGKKVETFGVGALSGSRGIAVNGKTEHLYATTEGEKIVVFNSALPQYEPIDNPAVLHGVRDSGTHHWSDFQVTPSGQFAAFATSQPLDEGFDNEGHMEVYRYATDGPELDCVSCPPTNALATSDASLASNGLSLADDGRVFFDTGEPIVLRDGDGTKDVYEWEENGAGPSTGGCRESNPNYFPTGICLSLISSGTSQFDSSLLTATADGNDAFFFTHDSLAPEDENGPIAKIYDARTQGGFFAVPPRALCAASDECHGPGTESAPPPPIRTTAGTPPGNPKTGCRKGFVKKKGKCVKKPKRKTRKHKKHGKKGRG